MRKVFGGSVRHRKGLGLTPKTRQHTIKLMVKSQQQVGTNRVHLNSEGVIVLVFEGQQTAENNRSIYKEVVQLVEQCRRENKKVILFCDISRLKASDGNTAARNESKKLINLETDLSVIVGSGPMMAMTLYLVRLMRPNIKVQYFTSARRAWAWLERNRHPSKQRPTLSLIAAIILITIGLMALIGWQISNPFLRGFLGGLRPMNPVAAVGLLIMGTGYAAYWLNAVKWLRITGIIGIIIGTLALLPVNIDHLLYGGRVAQAGAHTQLADSAAICFIAMGAVALVARRSGRWVQLVEYGAVAIVGVTSLFNIYGQLYAKDFMYNLSPTFVMALNLAVAFATAAISLILLVVAKHGKDVLGKVSKIGWLIVIALLGVQLATYALWHQAVERNKTEARQEFNTVTSDLTNHINSRIAVYENALKGYQGFFLASDYVSQKDFETYFQALNLAKNYPGLRTIAYVAKVPTAELGSFTKQQRQDTSLQPAGSSSFQIQRLSASPEHFIVTYTGGTPFSASRGIDLSSVPGRSEIYEGALAAQSSYASGTVTFLKTATQPAERGFFIALPVKNNNSPDYTGVVSANFNYKDFFEGLFSKSSLDKELNLTIRDSGTQIYTVDNLAGEEAYNRVINIPVGNRVWNIEVETGPTFEVPPNQVHTPMVILISGQVLTVLLVLVFVLQGRARRQALNLADEITADLQQERNHITELHKKDEAILGSIGEGLVVLSRHGVVERINLAAQRLLGRTEEELLGKHFINKVEMTNMEHHVLPAAARPATQAIIQQKTITKKVYYTRQDGRRFPAELNVSPIITKGRVIGAIEVFRDITHDYELDKAKGEFVSLASHQLRTPLSAINWYAEMLLNGDAGKLTEDQVSYLREIYEGNQRMIELVNSLLDVSRLELGRMANNPEPTDVSELVEGLEKELMTSIRTKNLNFKKQLPQRINKVIGDPKLLRIVVQNLMSNAVKYTPDKGSVSVVLRTAKKSEVTDAGLHAGQPFVFFSVTDSGYGIPVEQQPHIFEKLFRADNVRKLDVEGTGLGLYIVKQVVENMGGKVWFESRESLGTTFFVLLPFKTRTGRTAQK